MSAFLPVEVSAQDDGWHIVWQDKFDVDGNLDYPKREEWQPMNFIR